MGDHKKNIIKFLAFGTLVIVLNFSFEANAANSRIQTKTRAVSVTYKSENNAYAYAHRACQRYWKRDIASVLRDRATFSVEVLTVSKSPKTISALCVSKKYINDEVTKVAKK